MQNYLYLCKGNKHTGAMNNIIQPQLDYYNMGEGLTAFSSRRGGGCSTDNYASFNINLFCGDSEEHIQKNRQALCQLLHISDDRLVMPHQIHLTNMARIDETFLSLPESQRCEAIDGYDALMTNLSHVCIGVSTADCIPILLYDKVHHAACAIHAGWRGTVARIAEKAVAEMINAYGTRPDQLRAQIGPGIHLDSFEVGNEVYEAFEQAGFNMALISRHDEKWHINLPECNRLQLLAAGVRADAISVSPICTYQHATDYFSARRLGINSGRIFTGCLLK